jgi:hypothetical protein
VAPGRDDLLAEAILRIAFDGDGGLEQGRRARLLLDEKFSRDTAHRQWRILLDGLGAGSRESTEVEKS